MFPSRYFGNRYFAPRFFANLGGIILESATHTFSANLYATTGLTKTLVGRTGLSKTLEAGS